MVLSASHPRGIGAMRDQVELRVPTFGKDAGGAITTTYATTATVPAYVEQISSRERLIAAANRVRIQARVSLRYYEGLDETYQLRIGDRVFEILGVTNPDGRLVEHVCDVAELRGGA